MYLSEYEDWISPQSILGVIVVTHAEIGELTRGSRSHSQLLEDSVFFYDAFYRPRHGTGYGTIESIPLPAFDSPYWPLPDMATTESFRAKLWQDFQNSMRPTTSSKQTNISWFMPIGVFIDLFYVATNMRRTKMMFVYKEVTEELCASLMDRGWDTKITRIRDAEFLKTIAARGSMSFRYHIPRSTLYANFVYNRYRLLPDKTWEPLEQYEPIETVILLCDLDDVTHELEVGLTWTIHEIRQEIRVMFAACEESAFDIWIVNEHGVASKVNSRNEKNVPVSSCLQPKKLIVVQRP